MIAFIKKIGRGVVRYWRAHKNFRRAVGILLIVYGVIALVAPILPGGFLIFVGLEILGFKILLWERFKGWAGRVFSYKKVLIILRLLVRLPIVIMRVLVNTVYLMGIYLCRSRIYT